jgi:hypothetical protein
MPGYWFYFFLRSEMLKQHVAGAVLARLGKACSAAVYDRVSKHWQEPARRWNATENCWENTMAETNFPWTSINANDPYRAIMHCPCAFRLGTVVAVLFDRGRALCSSNLHLSATP